jgi:hypothetical protein
MADSAPSRPRMFIFAPAGTDLRPLLTGLEGRGASPYVLSDVAPLGADILQSLQQAIASADTVIVVLGEEPALDPAFEAGVAVALGKSLVVLADPQAAIPSNLAGLLTVRARPDDLTAINFALDQAQIAVSECDPMANLEVNTDAVPLRTMTGLLRLVLPSLNCTVSVAVAGVTVAVNATGRPSWSGDTGDVVNTVVVDWLALPSVGVLRLISIASSPPTTNSQAAR